MYLNYVDHLHKMAKLPEQHHEVHQHFKEYLRTIRRFDFCWSRLYPNLVTEQCLMRCHKTTCGLTRCEGFPEAQRLLWVLSVSCIPAYANVNNSIQQFTNVTHNTMNNTRKPLVLDFQRIQKTRRRKIPLLYGEKGVQWMTTLILLVTRIIM